MGLATLYLYCARGRLLGARLKCGAMRSDACILEARQHLTSSGSGGPWAVSLVSTIMLLVHTVRRRSALLAHPSLASIPAQTECRMKSKPYPTSRGGGIESCVRLCASLERTTTEETAKQPSVPPGMIASFNPRAMRPAVNSSRWIHSNRPPRFPRTTAKGKDGCYGKWSATYSTVRGTGRRTLASRDWKDVHSSGTAWHRICGVRTATPRGSSKAIGGIIRGKAVSLIDRSVPLDGGGYVQPQSAFLDVTAIHCQLTWQLWLEAGSYTLTFRAHTGNPMLLSTSNVGLEVFPWMDGFGPVECRSTSSTPITSHRVP
ncbi:hypothetical protein BJ875DRAFT_436645 [Amylocarpus encephaloides]|uniref:Uncharacterized protein n=1 Tax=Amylocarpus encephaloides TaxID=45428 RepID=A0A9P7YT17_9HELO|nr:hypothetical protein BJ875DRAFT_436645 [Amylocarpus encephaloides]